MHLQAPPNLSDESQRLRLLDAGIDDWGGVSPVTPDHVNPERPWPQIDRLAATHRGARQAAPRAARDLPRVRDRARSLARRRRCERPVEALIGADGLAADTKPAPVAWQDAAIALKPRTIALTFTKADAAGLREDAEPVYGTFANDNAVTAAWAADRPPPERIDAEIRSGAPQGRAS